MELGLRDKVAVVTGGGMGIGQAIALELAKEGVHVSILDINAEAAMETAIQKEWGAAR
jgi:NAD(P)-dependent dehydrogenase (short-subunit alcohol dehydrogenase family)